MASTDVEWDAARADRSGTSSENGSGCTFDETSSKYRCACGSCHIVDGVKIFLGIYVAASVAGFFAFYPYSLFAIILPIMFTTTAAQAIDRQDPLRLWPFLIVQAFVVLSCIAGAITVIVLFAMFDKTLVNALDYYGVNANNSLAFFSALALIVLTLIVLTIIAVWSFIVTKDCQAFYQAKQMIGKEKEELSRKNTTASQYTRENEDNSRRIPMQIAPSRTNN